MAPQAVLLLLWLPGGCAPPESGGATAGGEEVFTLEVASDRVPCRGEMSGFCLRIREEGEADWRAFYEPIEGFRPETGVRYTIRVARRRVPDPPADGSSYRWRLIEIVRRSAGGS